MSCGNPEQNGPAVAVDEFISVNQNDHPEAELRLN